MTRSDAALGPNAWLVDEMYEQYLADPGSVSESWRDFFADYRRDADHMAPPTPGGATASGNGAQTAANGTAPAATNLAPAPSAPAPASAKPATAAAAPAPKSAKADKPAKQPPADEGEPLRGVAARIVENM